MGFKRLDAEDFVVSADSVQSTAWSTGLPTLTSFYTSSVQAGSTSGNFYLSIYQDDVVTSASSATVQFDITYGNVNGLGSEYYNGAVPSLTPSRTVYGQYRTLVLEDENTNFSYGTDNNVFTPNDFWALSVERARYKEKLFPGTFNITLSGSGGLLNLTDNSNDVNVQTFIGSNRVFQIVSGSDGSAIAANSGYAPGSGSYGLFLPDIGTILLNPAAISESINLVPNRTADLTNGTNQATLYTAISGGGAFELNAQETITSDYIFVRSRNSEFNYSENPSFISGSTGEIIYEQFINNPQVYITTVGMYNDANELIAVAKMSKPLLKDFTKESLVRVKLDF
jgi:hypothetical protein